MKFYRIEKELPANVALRIKGEFTSPEQSLLDKFGFGFTQSQSRAEYKSTAPVTLVIEVPEEGAADAAKAFQEMADELAREIVKR